jgi:hypothetical protein
MDTQTTLSNQDLVDFIASETAKAVSERTGETRQQQNTRGHTATQAVLSFQPNDVVEAMIASHCVMLHEMMVADVHRALCAQEPATRSHIVAMDRAFGNNLNHLRRRQIATRSDPQPAEDRTETDLADRIRRHLAPAKPVTQAATADAIAGLNRQARRALERRTRKRAPGIPGSGVMPDRNAATTITSATAAS